MYIVNIVHAISIGHFNVFIIIIPGLTLPMFLIVTVSLSSLLNMCFVRTQNTDLVLLN